MSYYYDVQDLSVPLPPEIYHNSPVMENPPFPLSLIEKHIICTLFSMFTDYLSMLWAKLDFCFAFVFTYDLSIHVKAKLHQGTFSTDVL